MFFVVIKFTGSHSGNGLCLCILCIQPPLINRKRVENSHNNNSSGSPHRKAYTHPHFNPSQEIIEHYVNLKDSDLTPKEAKALIKVILKYKKAFSLRDEIGTCPHIEVKLELQDTKPFSLDLSQSKKGKRL